MTHSDSPKIQKWRENISKKSQEVTKQKSSEVAVAVEKAKQKSEAILEATKQKSSEVVEKIDVVEKARQIEYAAKVRYALEGERLAAFSAKWVRYCESMTQAVDKNLLQQAKEYVEKAQKEIEQGLKEDLDLGAYLGEAAEIYDSERGRLAKLIKK